MDPGDVPPQLSADLPVDSPANLRPTTFITAADLTSEERARVPRVWLDALEWSGRERVAVVLDEWDRLFGPRLPRTCARLRAACTDLILGRRAGTPVLVYVLEGHFGARRYSSWVATPPVRAIPEGLVRLPSAVRAFHTQLHDDTASPLSGGTLPVARMELVSTYDDPTWPFELYTSRSAERPWEALPESAPQPDWTQVVVIHTDRASTRICAVLGDDPDATNGWLWIEGSMSEEPDIWELMDEQLERAAGNWYEEDFS